MLSKQQLSISEVSQQTGIATVTLRAWERRHGLVKPQRTAKGHRLYSEDNVKQIKQIISWLDRGVSIGKVPDLLTDKIEGNEQDLYEAGDSWQQLTSQLSNAVEELHQINLNQLLDKSNKSTPFLTLSEQVYLPCHHYLTDRWTNGLLGHQLEQQVWQQAWQRQLTIMSLRAAKQKASGDIWLVNTDKRIVPIEFFLLYNLLIQSGLRVHTLNKVEDIASLSRLTNINKSPLLVVGTNKLENNDLVKLDKINDLYQQNLLVMGYTASIHTHDLSQMNINHCGGYISDCWRDKITVDWLKKVIVNP